MLYGWLEVGASNISIFSSQSNQDIILRTTNAANKIMIGNQLYNLDAGSNIPAAVYISSNNVGINKVPVEGVQLDIAGRASINNSLTFTETLIGSGGAILDQPASFVNSNNALYISYNGVERMRFTANSGINVVDKVVSTQDFFAPAFNVLSDSNLKRDIILSDAESDRARMRGINVYDYRFHNSSSNIKGFIAQQVETAFPQAVQKTFGFIPCNRMQVMIMRNGDIDRTLQNLPFDNIEVGEKLCAAYNGVTYEFLVCKVSDSNINVYGSGPAETGGLVQFYGKHGYIRTIDTNQLLALCFNNIKTLSEKVAALEQKAKE